MKRLITLLFTLVFAVTAYGSNYDRMPTKYKPHEIEWKQQQFNKVKVQMYLASEQSGIDMGDGVAIASLESGFQNIKNPHGSANGIFQFIDSTWQLEMRRYHKELGIPRHHTSSNVNSNIKLGYRSLAGMKAYLAKNSPLSEKQIRAGDLYMSHFLGPDRAITVLKANIKNPNVPITKYVRISKGNKPLFYKNGKIMTVREFRDNFQIKINEERKVYEDDIRDYQLAQLIKKIENDTNGPVKDNLMLTYNGIKDIVVRV